MRLIPHGDYTAKRKARHYATILLRPSMILESKFRYAFRPPSDERASPSAHSAGKIAECGLGTFWRSKKLLGAHLRKRPNFRSALRSARPSVSKALHGFFCQSYQIVSRETILVRFEALTGQNLGVIPCGRRRPLGRAPSRPRHEVPPRGARPRARNWRPIDAR